MEGEKMKREFKIIIYDMPNIKFKADKNKIQEILINALDKFIDIEEM